MTPTKTRLHKPMLAEWTSESPPSLSLQKDAGSHNECHPKQGTQKHSASQLRLGREGRRWQPVPCATSCPSQWATCEHQAENERSGACTCHSGATESTALARTNARKPTMICAQLRPFGGRRPRRSMKDVPEHRQCCPRQDQRECCLDACWTGDG